LRCEKFGKGFQDFKIVETELLLFTLPSEAGIQKSAESMQMELINLKCNTNTNQKSAETGFQGESSRRKFPVLGSFVLKMIAMYSSTYKSVQFLTLMYNNKTKQICFDRWVFEVYQDSGFQRERKSFTWSK